MLLTFSNILANSKKRVFCYPHPLIHSFYHIRLLRLFITFQFSGTLSPLAGVAELVDAHDSKSCSARSEGSIPSFGTRMKRPFLLLNGLFIFVEAYA